MSLNLKYTLDYKLILLLVVSDKLNINDSGIWVQEIVLCKIYRKATSLKVLEQRAALEEEREMKQLVGSPASPPSSTDTMSFNSPQEEQNMPDHHTSLQHVLKKESEVETEETVVSVSLSMPKQEKPTNQLGLIDNKMSCGTSLQLPFGKPELQMPITDWTQDTFWAQLSPWLQNLTPSNILNY